MRLSIQGPIAAVILALVGLYLLFAPIGQLARKPSPLKTKRKMRPEDVPTWMKVFFRGLGIALVVFAALLLTSLATSGSRW